MKGFEKFFRIVEHIHGERTRNNANRFASKFNVRVKLLNEFLNNLLKTLLYKSKPITMFRMEFEPFFYQFHEEIFPEIIQFWYHTVCFWPVFFKFTPNFAESILENSKLVSMHTKIARILQNGENIH